MDPDIEQWPWAENGAGKGAHQEFPPDPDVQLWGGEDIAKESQHANGIQWQR